MYLEPFDRRKERSRMRTIGLALFSMYLTTVLVFYGLYLLLSRVAPSLAEQEQVQTILTYLAQYGAGVAVCVLIMRIVPADPIETHEVDFVLLFRFLCIGSFFLYAGGYLGDSINELIGILRGRDVYDVVTESILGEGFWVNLVTAVILAPITEELIFRKLLLDRVNRYGDAIAMWLSGILFGLYHGNLYQFFYAAWVGCLLAYLYLRTGKLRYCIGIHMALNFLFGVLVTFIDGMEEGLLYDVTLSAANSIMLVMVMIGMVAFFRRFRRLHLLKGWLDAENGEINRAIWLNAGMILLMLVLTAEFVLNILA